MQVTDPERETIIRYLLGERFDAPVLLALERRYFEDSDFFERLSIAEDELIGDYLGSRLGWRKRKLFERNFLASSRRRERLAFLQALDEVTSSPKRAVLPAAPLLPNRWALRGLVAATCVLFLLAAALLIERYMFGQPQLQALMQENLRLDDAFRREAEQRRQAERFLAEARNPAPLTVSFVLAPSSSVRGELAPAFARRHVISRAVASISLELILPSGLPSTRYQVAIETPERMVLWSDVVSGPFPGALGPRVSVPSALLGSNDYIVSLDRITNGNPEPAARYLFQTSKQ